MWEFLGDLRILLDVRIFLKLRVLGDLRILLDLSQFTWFEANSCFTHFNSCFELDLRILLDLRIEHLIWEFLLDLSILDLRNGNLIWELATWFENAHGHSQRSTNSGIWHLNANRVAETVEQYLGSMNIGYCKKRKEYYCSLSIHNREELILLKTYFSFHSWSIEK